MNKANRGGRRFILISIVRENCSTVSFHFEVNVVNTQQAIICQTAFD